MNEFLKSHGCKVLVIIAILLLLPFFYSQAQIHIPESFVDINLVDTLAEILDENSGIFMHEGFPYFINDSRNKAAIYKWDIPSGRMGSIIKVKNTFNIDWEDCDADSNYICIGDIGNNFGFRKRLKVLWLPSTQLNDPQGIGVKIAKYSYKYADSRGFHFKPMKNPNDAEGLFIFRDTVYIFTKDRPNASSSIYKLGISDQNKTSRLRKTGIIELNGLTTGACIDRERFIVALVGYNTISPFIILTTLNNLNNNGPFLFVQLSSLKGHALEGICFFNSDTLFVSSEKRYYPAMLFQVSIQDVLLSNEWSSVNNIIGE